MIEMTKSYIGQVHQLETNVEFSEKKEINNQNMFFFLI